MTRYWAIRTDTRNNTPYIWRELQAGRLRQGWGRRPEEDLEHLAAMRAAGQRLDEDQRQTWRGNRRLLPMEDGAVTVGDLVIAPHVPRYGLWTILRVTGPYRYSIDDGRNWMGKPDFGHILPVAIVTDPIPWHDPAIPSRLGRAMRFRQRMRNLDPFASDVEELAGTYSVGREGNGYLGKSISMPRWSVPMGMTYLEAARAVLQEAGASLHSSEITQRALDQGLIAPRGKTPEATMAAQLYSAIKRAERAGDDPPFRLAAANTFELSASVASVSLEGDVHKHNEAVQQKLLAFLLDMHPRQVELLIGKLLGSLGFEDVAVTKYVGDSGIDIDATLTLGGVTSVRTAVQVKRYKSNIAGDLVRQVRGSLEADQRGLIITTGGFTKDARGEASATGKTPVSLVDGKRLVELLVEQQIGVTRHNVHLLKLNLGELVTAESPDTDGKAAALWPLPGGAANYVETLLSFVDQIADSKPTLDDLTAWVIANYPTVKSRGVVASVVRTVLYALRLVRFVDDRIVLSEQGEALRVSRSQDEILAALTTRITGVTEILQWLQVGSLSTDEVLDRMRKELSVTWETEIQARHRLDWLQAVGAVRGVDGRWELVSE
jgi:HJR/Mrr/RecB family endonuclease